MSDRIAIALAADSNYFCGLMVTATSIARFAHKDAHLVFNILDGGIADSDFAFLEGRIKALHGRSEINRISVDDAQFDGFPIWHGSRMTYARLLLPRLLPDDDFVVYCDVDFLWMDDIADLWRIRDAAIPLMGTRDVNEVITSSENAWFERNGLKVDIGRYFCAGFVFVNLKVFREEGLAERALDLIRSHPDIPMNDQTALNAVVEGRHRLLPAKWQMFSRDSPIELFDRLPFVIHYAGDVPWKISKRSHMLTDIQLLWFHFDAAVRGISVWQSLRRHYSACEIVLNRVTFKMVMGFPPLKFAFDALMRKLGRWGFYEKLPPHVFADLKRACRD